MTPGPTSRIAVIRDLERIEDLRAAEALFSATWPGQPPATAGLLKALVHAGGYVSGAYADGELVGAAAAFLADHHGPALHSHLAAVPPEARGLGVGRALKLHQRDWAAARGLRVVTWTFDPLVRRNAWFNLAKLGAEVDEYLVDFYGRMDDGVNDGDESDRMFAVWPVSPVSPVQDRPRGQARGPGLPEGGEAAAAVEEVHGRPVVHEVGDADVVTVATPADVESLRRADAGLARAWRIAVREAVVPRFGTYRVAGFTRAGSYLLARRG